MENSKIVLVFSFCIFLFLCCNCKGLQNTRNADLFRKNEEGQLVLSLPSNSGKQVRLEKVYLENDRIGFASKVINEKTFDLLFNFSEDVEKINNKYYLTNPIDNYYKDRNNIYIYQYLNRENSKFIVAGKIDEYEILGGAYLRVGNKIYWRGEEVLEPDLQTFKTINVTRNRSEWDATIGLDKKYLYEGNKLMTFEIARDKYFIDKHLLDKYFSEDMQ